jgi:hypothetical protein
MSAHHKKVSDLEPKQIEVNKQTLWGKLPIIGEVPLGAVSPLLAPSWLTEVARTTARTSWPLACASESRSSANTITPSPRP